MYSHLYQRTEIQLGRLVDLLLVLVVAYAVLTSCWQPVDRAVGGLFRPLGAASLYVFTVHVFLTLAVANVPGLDYASWWQGLLVHSVVLALTWLMVTRRFLFRLIPT